MTPSPDSDAAPSWPTLDPSQRVAESKAYFAPKAQKYDDVDNQPYWAFSDELLWELLQTLVLNKLQDRGVVHLLDAGAGTARWSSRIMQFLPMAQGTLIDASPDMLGVAKEKMERLGLADRSKIFERDLQTFDPTEFQGQDLVISFHNVLSFVDKPEVVIDKLMRTLAPGGTMILVIPNRYHAAYFSLFQGRWKELERVRASWSVKFADSVPEMFVFTPDAARATLLNAGAADVKTYGFPVTIYPQMEETAIAGSSGFAKKVLSDEMNRRFLLDFEKELCQREEAAARGNNLLVIARKPA